MKKTMILGVGNYLMGDEGLGVHLAKSLENEELPSHITVLDGGTGGFHLLQYFEEHDRVIIVDATLDGREPGSIRLIKPRYASDYPAAMSSHEIGLKDMIAAMHFLGKEPEVYIFVVSIETLQQQGIELTREIAGVMEELKERVVELAAGLTTSRVG